MYYQPNLLICLVNEKRHIREPSNKTLSGLICLSKWCGLLGSLCQIELEPLFSSMICSPTSQSQCPPLSSKALNPLRLNWHELTSCFSDQSLGRALEFSLRVSGFCGFGSVVDPFSLVGTTTYLACHRLTPQRMFFSQVRLSCNRCGHAKEVFKYNVNRIWPCWTAQSRQIYRSAHDWTLRDS